MCQPKYFACIFRLTQKEEGLINGSKNRSSVMNLAHRGQQRKRAVEHRQEGDKLCMLRGKALGDIYILSSLEGEVQQVF